MPSYDINIIAKNASAQHFPGLSQGRKALPFVRVAIVALAAAQAPFGVIEPADHYNLVVVLYAYVSTTTYGHGAAVVPFSEIRVDYECRVTSHIAALSTSE